MSLEGAIARSSIRLRRAAPAKSRQPAAIPKAWLMAQIGTAAEQPAALDGGAFADSGDLVRQEQAMIAARRAIKAGDTETQIRSRRWSRHVSRSSPTRWRRASRWASPPTRPFAERLVWFWSNHFTVSTHEPRAPSTFVGAFEREAIRPHITDKFEDMLLAVAQPSRDAALSRQCASIGPDSPAGMRTGKGLQRKSRPRADGALHAGRRWRLHPGRRDRAGQHPHRLGTGSATAQRQRLSASIRTGTSPATSTSARQNLSAGLEGGIAAVTRSGARSAHRASYRHQVRHPFHRRRSAAAVGGAAGEDVQRDRRRSAGAGAGRRWTIRPPGRRRPARCARRWNM